MLFADWGLAAALGVVKSKLFHLNFAEQFWENKYFSGSGLEISTGHYVTKKRHGDNMVPR